MYMAQVCFYVCCSDCVGVCGNVCNYHQDYFFLYILAIILSPMMNYCAYFRRDANQDRANAQLVKLKDSQQLQQFLQECDELSEWLSDKMIAAQDESYRDAKNIHSKYVRYQAFESEIGANKDRLTKLEGGV